MGPKKTLFTPTVRVWILLDENVMVPMLRLWALETKDEKSNAAYSVRRYAKKLRRKEHERRERKKFSATRTRHDIVAAVTIPVCIPLPIIDPKRSALPYCHHVCI